MGPLLVTMLGSTLAVTGAMGALLLLLWRQALADTKKAFSKPLGRSWSTERPLFPTQVGALDVEWQGLGYVYGGVLLAGENPNLRFVIYTHPELPVFASTLWIKAGDRDLAYPSLLTFFREGGKLTTTATTSVGANVAPVVKNSSRLVQFRLNATPEALDHQHRKVLDEWVARGRKPRPTAEAIVRYSLEDHEAIRRAVEVAGWLPFPTFFGILTGNPRGVARF